MTDPAVGDATVDIQPDTSGYVRDESSIRERFPDAGEPPPNDIVLDPDAEPAPNIGHE